MGRENKKEAVAALNRGQILIAAEKLFLEKGFDFTTIEDISDESKYSRRTIYAYYESKDDILHHIIEKGLISLKNDVENAVKGGDDFVSTYKEICSVLVKYQTECPQSLESVTKAKTEKIDFENLSNAVKRILTLGTEINELLVNFIEKGKQKHVVKQDVIPTICVYILTSNINSLIALAKSKGVYICKQSGVSMGEFYDYGFKQIINSILEERI